MDLAWLNVRRLAAAREKRKNHQVQAKILFTVLVKGSTMCVKRCLQKTLEKTDEAPAKLLVRLIPDCKSDTQNDVVWLFDETIPQWQDWSGKYRRKPPCYIHSWVTAGAMGRASSPTPGI